MYRPSLPDRSLRGLASSVLVVPLVAATACAGGDGSAADGRAVSSDDGPPASAAAEGDRDWRGTPVDPRVTIPAMTLTDTRGRPYELRDASRGRVTLLFAGYTHCPDVCPVQMANLGAVLDDLSPSIRRHVRVVFVTVDPARDTAARIRSWLDRFGEDFVGLRGSEEATAALQDSLGLPRAARQQRTVEGRYTVGHASQVLAVGPDGEARLAYPSGTRQRDWRHDLPRLVRELIQEGR